MCEVMRRVQIGVKRLGYWFRAHPTRVVLPSVFFYHKSRSVCPTRTDATPGNASSSTQFPGILTRHDEMKFHHPDPVSNIQVIIFYQK